MSKNDIASDQPFDTQNQAGFTDEELARVYTKRNGEWADIYDPHTKAWLTQSEFDTRNAEKIAAFEASKERQRQERIAAGVERQKAWNAQVAAEAAERRQRAQRAKDAKHAARLRLKAEHLRLELRALEAEIALLEV